MAVGDLQTGRDLHGKPPRQAGVVSPSRRGQRGGISFKPWPWGGCLMGGGEVQRAKRKERAEKRESREKKREKFSEQKAVGTVGSDQKNIGFLIFTKCTVAFQK